jgi:hypothetical protein
MDFDAYLLSKKIDAARFRAAEHAQYQTLRTVFDQTGEISFTQQKLFLINPLRRKYKWTEVPQATTAPTPKTKPIIKPKI